MASEKWWSASATDATVGNSTRSSKARTARLTGWLAMSDHSTPAALQASSISHSNETMCGVAELTALRSSTTGFSRRTKRLACWLTWSRFVSLRSPVTVTTVANWRLHARICAPLQSNAGLPYICRLPSIADLVDEATEPI